MVSKALKAPLALAGALFVGCTCYLPFVYSDMKKRLDDDCDCLLILGCTVHGSEPGEQLTERIKRAAHYLKTHPTAFAIACGGIVKKDQTVSEAAVIKESLISMGIDESRVLTEDRSKTTFENFANAALILSENGYESADMKIGFLTSDYHIHRSTVIADIEGFPDIRRVSSYTDSKRVRSFLREYVTSFELMYKYIFR